MEEIQEQQVQDTTAAAVALVEEPQSEPQQQAEDSLEGHDSPENSEEGQQREGSQQQPQTPKMVPLAALQETREELKATKAKLEEMSAQIAAWNQRAEAIRQKQEAVEQQSAAQAATADAQAKEKAAFESHVNQELGPRPDPEEDPLGARDWDREKRALFREWKRDQELQQLRNDIRQGSKASEEQKLAERVVAMREEFKQSHPDYDAALQHVMTVERAAARRAGYNQEQAEQYILSRASELIMGAMRQNKNPAESIYELAQDYGYKPASTAGVPTAAPTTATATAASTAPATTASRGPTANQKIEQRQAGQGVRSLGNGAAAPSNSYPTMEELDRMPQAEFQRRYRNEPGFKDYVNQMLQDEG